MLLTSVKTMEK